MQYFGPFEVIAKIGTMAYKLQLPPATKIHPVFHVSMLKKFQGPPSQQYLPLPFTTSEWGLIVHPYKVLARRVIIMNTLEVPQVLIQWDSSSTKVSTW